MCRRREGSRPPSAPRQLAFGPTAVGRTRVLARERTSARAGRFVPRANRPLIAAHLPAPRAHHHAPCDAAACSPRWQPTAITQEPAPAGAATPAAFTGWSALGVVDKMQCCRTCMKKGESASVWPKNPRPPIVNETSQNWSAFRNHSLRASCVVAAAMPIESSRPPCSHRCCSGLEHS